MTLVLDGYSGVVADGKELATGWHQRIRLFVLPLGAI